MHILGEILIFHEKYRYFRILWLKLSFRWGENPLKSAKYGKFLLFWPAPRPRPSGGRRGGGENVGNG